MTIKITCDECGHDDEDYQVCRDCYRALEQRLSDAESDRDDHGAEVRALTAKVAELEAQLEDT